MSNYNNKLNYLCIGHVCHDIKGDEYALGGTTSYASIVAQKLGMSTSILTSFGSDFQFEAYLRSFGIGLKVFPSKRTTTFENIYHNEGRTQFMHDRASTIDTSEINIDWEKQDIIHLCLIADELSHRFTLQLPKNKLVGLALQGATRAIDQKKQVYNKISALQRFERVDVAFYSDDDIAGLDGIEDQLIAVIPILVKTQGALGATIRTREATFFYPSYPSVEKDPTGAGDVFGAAFLIAYHESKDLKVACAFAHAAASLSIEGIGVASIPSIEAVKSRQKEYLKHII